MEPVEVRVMSLRIPDDNCPECATAEQSVTVRSYHQEPAALGAVKAYYRCRCGYRWFAAYLASALEQVAEGDAA
jgi:hypothetical protein